MGICPLTIFIKYGNGHNLESLFLVSCPQSICRILNGQLRLINSTKTFKYRKRRLEQVFLSWLLDGNKIGQPHLINLHATGCMLCMKLSCFLCGYGSQNTVLHWESIICLQVLHKRVFATSIHCWCTYVSDTCT